MLVFGDPVLVLSDQSYILQGFLSQPLEKKTDYFGGSGTRMKCLSRLFAKCFFISLKNNLGNTRSSILLTFLSFLQHQELHFHYLTCHPLCRDKGQGRTLLSCQETSFGFDRIVLINNNHNNIVLCILSRDT